MTYSADTAIIASDDMPVAASQAWLEHEGRRYAPQFGPGGQYVAPPSGLAQIVWEESRRYPEHVVAFGMTLSQMVHETAGFQSEYWRERWNPGGIGAINSNPDLAIRFPSPRAGVRAHIAHLLVYAVGDGRWSVDDPRRDAVAARNWIGKAPLWHDLNGRWAHPGTTYGQGIATIANRLQAFREHGTWEAPPMTDRTTMLQRMDERYPLTIRVDHIPKSNSNRPGTPAIPEGWSWFTVHETNNYNVGADAEMHRRFTHNGGGASDESEGVSFVWVVDDSEAINLLPIGQPEPPEKSWQASDGANGLGNSSESIETCENQDGNFSMAREHVARLMARRTIQDTAKSPDRIAQHNTWARDGKNCPDQMRANGGVLWLALIDRTRFILNDVGYFGDAAPPVPVEDPNAWLSEHVDYGNHWIVNVLIDGRWIAMLDGWRNDGGIAGLGLPLGGMTGDVVGGKPVYRQPFENGIAEFWPEGFGANPDPVFRRGGIPQNWSWYRPTVARIVKLWRDRAKEAA